MTDSPMSRLRERHRGFHYCDGGAMATEQRCDTIAALEELGERDDLPYEPEALREFRERGYVTKEVDALQARIDAATVLIRQAMKERHFSIQPNTGDSETRCGSPFGTSIDTCPNCAPFRAWLAGEKEETPCAG